MLFNTTSERVMLLMPAGRTFVFQPLQGKIVVDSFLCRTSLKDSPVPN